MKLEFERYTKLRNQISLKKKGLRKGQVSRDTQERKRGTVVRYTVHAAALRPGRPPCTAPQPPQAATSRHQPLPPPPRRAGQAR